MRKVEEREKVPLLDIVFDSYHKGINCNFDCRIPQAVRVNGASGVWLIATEKRSSVLNRLHILSGRLALFIKTLSTEIRIVGVVSFLNRMRYGQTGT